jgi:hypothetical protein
MGRKDTTRREMSEPVQDVDYCLQVVVSEAGLLRYPGFRCGADDDAPAHRGRQDRTRGCHAGRAARCTVALGRRITERDVLKALASTLPSLKGDPDDYFW